MANRVVASVQLVEAKTKTEEKMSDSINTEATKVPEEKIEKIPRKVIPEKVVSMRQLLETGVHFGHQTRRWNPKMKPYIYTSRNDIHVIDLQKTLVYINKAYEFIKEEVGKGATVMFVGTKKQARQAVEEEAKRCGMPYVTNRWLGGMLTNFDTIKKSIAKMKEIEEWKTNGTINSFVTKEQSVLNKRLAKLQFHLNGIRDMAKVPNIIFIVDTKKEEIGVHEANILKIPIVGIVDTNCDPEVISHPIPANDDAIRTIKLLANIVGNAVLEGKKLLPSSVEAQITSDLESQFNASGETPSMESLDFEASLDLQEMYEDTDNVEV